MKVSWIRIGDRLHTIGILCVKCQLIVKPEKCLVTIGKESKLFYQGGCGGQCIESDVIGTPIGQPGAPIPQAIGQPPYVAPMPDQQPWIPNDSIRFIYCPRCGEQVTFQEYVPVAKEAAENSGLLKKE